MVSNCRLFFIQKQCVSVTYPYPISAAKQCFLLRDGIVNTYGRGEGMCARACQLSWLKILDLMNGTQIERRLLVLWMARINIFIGLIIAWIVSVIFIRQRKMKIMREQIITKWIFDRIEDVSFSLWYYGRPRGSIQILLPPPYIATNDDIWI